MRLKELLLEADREIVSRCRNLKRDGHEAKIPLAAQPKAALATATARTVGVSAVAVSQALLTASSLQEAEHYRSKVTKAQARKRRRQRL